MPKSQSPKLHESLRNPGGDDDYYSNDDLSIHSASSLSEDTDRENEGNEREISNSEESGSESQLVSRHKNSTGSMPKLSKPTPRPSSQSFPLITESQASGWIMPTMPGSPIDPQIDSQSYSQLRPRKMRKSSRQSQASSVSFSPKYNGDESIDRARPKRNVLKSSRQSQAGSVSSSPKFDYERIDRARQERKVKGLFGHYLKHLWANFIQPLAQYALDILRHTMHYLKPLFVVILILFTLWCFAQYCFSLLHGYVETGRMSICSIPGTSFIFPFCNTRTSSSTYVGQAPDFEKLTQVQSNFEQVLDANKDSNFLPATLEDCTIALRSLRAITKYSRLPSRSELVTELSFFIETAEQISEDLVTYNGKIGHTVDLVISMNRFTLMTLEGIAAREDSEGSLARALAYVNPFSSTGGLEKRIFDQYILHLDRVEDYIEDLLKLSEQLLGLLKSLDTQLDTIAEIAARDDIAVNRHRDELLSLLWTKLGGNRSSKKDSDASLGLLKQVQSYRMDAVRHVSATLIKLRKIKVELKSLGEDVTTPRAVGFDGGIPLRHYIEMVEKSSERLIEARGKRRDMEQEINGGRLGDEDRGRKPELPGRKETTTVYAKATGK